MEVTVNVYATAREVGPPPFAHELLQRRDRSDPELHEHLQGFVGYIMNGGERAMTQSLYHAMRHIERVQHHLSLTVDEQHFDALAGWSRQANAILFLPDGAVRDPSGRVLVDPETGKAEPEAMVPYPQEAIVRKLRHDAHLKSQGVPVASSLPPVVGETEVTLRAPAEVARRCLALLVIALRAESVNGGDPVGLGQLAKRCRPGVDALTQRERQFAAADAPPQQAVIDHVWRYEGAHLLAWALGLLPVLPPPAAVCSASSLTATVLGHDADALVRDAKLRPAAAILDALDLHLRIHWAVREAQRQGQPAPPSIDPGVVAERHYALNWLTSFEDAAWDDIDTPT